MTDGVATRASAGLMAAREEIARAATSALYAESPSLLERHGEAGRTKCLQDMRYNLDHLIPAVDLDDAAMFARYVTWLVQLLNAHGVETRHVARSLELLQQGVEARLPPDESARVRRIVAAGLTVARA